MVEWNIITFMCVISSLMSGASSLLVFSSHRWGAPFLWGVISLALTLWTFGLFLCFSAEDAASALFWSHLLNYVALFLPVLVFHFAVLFVGQLKYHVRVLQFYYLVTVIYLLSAIVWPEGFLLEPRYRLNLFWFPMLGPLFYFFPILIFGVLGNSIQILVSARAGQNRKKKLQNSYLLLTIIVGMIGAGSTLPLEFGIDIPPYGVLCVALMNVMFTYAMLKHDLLDIPETFSLIIARLMAYICIFFIVVIVLQLDVVAQETAYSRSQLVFIGLLMVLACELYSSIKGRLQRMSDRMLTHRKLVSKSSLRRLLTSLEGATDYDEMLPLLRAFFERQAFVHHYSWYLDQGMLDDSVSQNENIEEEVYQRLLFSTGDGKRHDKLPVILRMNHRECIAKSKVQKLNHLMQSEQLDGMYAWVEQVPEREVITLPIVSNNTFYGLFLLVVSTSDMHYSDQGLVNELSEKLAFMVERIAFHRKQSSLKQKYLLDKMASLQALAGSIAHEMRTPLTQLDFFVSSVITKSEAENAFDSELSSQANLAQLSIERSLQIIDITLRQVRNQQPDPQVFQSLSIQETVTKALAEYVFLPAERDGVYSDLRQNFEFKGDETSLIFLLFNLLKNALFYGQCRDDFRISISSVVDERQNLLIFRDNGPGVSPDLQVKIFEDFFSVNNEQGTGLGLAYCKRVMHSMGGDISCISVLGEFTEFRLQFSPC